MLDPETLKRLVSEALRQALPVDRERAKLARKRMEVTVNKKRRSYWNPRVMEDVSGLWGGQVGFLKFVPMKEIGHIIVLPAQEGELGAEAITYSPTHRAGWVNLYGALLEFPLQFTGNRRLRLPFSTLETTDADGNPRVVGLLRVKDPQSTPGTTRKAKASRKAGAQPAPPQPQTPDPQPEAP